MKKYWYRYGLDGDVIGYTRRKYKEHDVILLNNRLFVIKAVGANWYVIERNKGGLNKWEVIK